MRRFAVCAAVFFASWAWFAGGGEWSLMFHPDEAKVAAWSKQAFESGYVTDRVYPGGWFQVARVRAALARAALRAGAKWRGWRAQDGAVVAVDAATFHPRDPAGPPAADGPFTVRSGRGLNAFLAAAAAAAVFLAALELGAGAAAAALGAAAFCVQPLVVEHVHYCETDIALVAFFALSCWLFCRFLSSPRPLRAAAALFAAGFAVSCKYTLLPLLAWAPVAAALLAREGRAGAGGRRAARTAAFAAAGLLAFAAGFLLGTPALVRDPAWFRASAAEISARTYAETAGILGPFARTRWGGPALRAGSFLRSGAALGWGFWALAAAGAAAWARRAPRRQALGIPLFLAVFLPWTLFGLPWFRAQEFLPVAVAAAVASSLAFRAAWRREEGPAGAAR